MTPPYLPRTACAEEIGAHLGAIPRRSTLARRMGAIPINIAEHVGNTPMVRLTRLVPEGLDVELFGKLEAFNPGGSASRTASASR